LGQRLVVFGGLGAAFESVLQCGNRSAHAAAPLALRNTSTMPIAAKDQIGLLKDFKFVKVADDKILVVDPATRKIVDTVTKEDAQ
jgi:hypothetical protein